jgi:hypothetical protein
VPRGALFKAAAVSKWRIIRPKQDSAAAVPISTFQGESASIVYQF